MKKFLMKLFGIKPKSKKSAEEVIKERAIQRLKELKKNKNDF